MSTYGVLVTPLAALVGVAAAVQYYWGGVHLRAAATAVGLMLTAGVAGLAADGWLTRKAGPISAYAVTLSLRMAAGMGGGLMMVYGLGWFAGADVVFWVWLIVVYNVALVAETAALVRAGG